MNYQIISKYVILPKKKKKKLFKAKGGAGTKPTFHLLLFLKILNT